MSVSSGSCAYSSVVLSAERPGHVLPVLTVALLTALALAFVVAGAPWASVAVAGIGLYLGRVTWAAQWVAGRLHVSPAGIRLPGSSAAYRIGRGSLMARHWAWLVLASSRGPSRIAVLRRAAQDVTHWRRFRVLWHAGAAADLNKPLVGW